MKTKLILALAIVTSLFFLSCSKDKPQMTFTNNTAEGTADNQGNYTITGHIS